MDGIREFIGFVLGVVMIVLTGGGGLTLCILLFKILIGMFNGSMPAVEQIVTIGGISIACLIMGVVLYAVYMYFDRKFDD